MLNEQQILNAMREFEKWYDKQVDPKTRNLKEEPPQWFESIGIIRNYNETYRHRSGRK
jgi:hypothetical protein